jgi:hypothetical protein
MPQAIFTNAKPPAVHSKQAGFTLLVVSVLIMTSSVLLFAFLKPKPVIYAEQVAVTQKRLDVIEAALTAYALNIGYINTGTYSIPCPAALNIAQGAAGFGLSAHGCSDCSDGYVDGSDSGIFCTDGTKVLRGAIPVRTLSLPDEMAHDGFGQLFSYVIDANMTIEFTQMSPSNLNVTATNLDYPTITPYDLSSQIPVALIISHGPGWGGSYGAGGTAVACPIIEYNGENCDNDEVYFHDRWRQPYDGKYSNISRLLLYPPNNMVDAPPPPVD